MDSAQNPSIIHALITLVSAALGTGGLAWFNAWQGRRDKLRQAERDTQADVVARDQALWERLEGDNEELRDRLKAAGGVIEALRREVTRWEALARWWFRKAHSLNHALLSARWGARQAMEQAGKPVPENWTEQEELPQPEAPLPPPAASSFLSRGRRPVLACSLPSDPRSRPR